MSVDILLGLQWGDEGKGKIVDMLAPRYDVVARFQGGPNAGHTLVINNKKFILHSIPSGIIHQDKLNVIGNGMVINPQVLINEINILQDAGIDVKNRLYLSNKAHLILPTHKLLDAAFENAKGIKKIGSTLKGIGPAYCDKASREGVRIGDIFLPEFNKIYKALLKKHCDMLDMVGFEYSIDEESWMNAIEKIRKLKVVNTEALINQMLIDNKNVLAEGAQGTLLDIDFGTYPYVTSSNTIAASACTGLGISPRHVNKIIGITKAYTTRVGSGPFPTELNNTVGEAIRKAGNEFGSTTGRPRRCGWLDLPALKYACIINGVTDLIMTKADVLSGIDEVNVAVDYNFANNGSFLNDFDLNNVISDKIKYKSFSGWDKDLIELTGYNEMPENLKTYINYLSESLNIPFIYISTGPDRKQIVDCVS